MKGMSKAGLLRFCRHHVRLISIVLLAALTPVLIAGCFGRFPITKRVFEFNNEISPDRTIRTITFWVLLIIPLYELSFVSDVLIVNLVEFWTGYKLFAVNATDANGNLVALTPGANENEAVLTLSHDGKVLSQHRFVRAADKTVEVRDMSGQLKGRIVPGENGALQLKEADGATVRTLTPEAIAALTAK